MSIDEAKTIPFATVTEFLTVTEQNVESVLVEEVVESLNAAEYLVLSVRKYLTDQNHAAPVG